MGRELLVADAAMAEAFAELFLPTSEDGVICVDDNLSSATAANTLLSLVSCRRDTSTKLQ